MNKESFVNDASIKPFILWIGDKLDRSESFVHSYQSLRSRREWHCDSIYSAYEGYSWPFCYKDPINRQTLRGETFEESERALAELSTGLRKSVNDQNALSCQKYCIAILEWGGVLANNNNRILNFGDKLPEYLRDVQRKINPAIFHSTGDFQEITMNAGFTKIYSLLINDFIIYDGRVGAALGLLVRRYCEQFDLPFIPPLLRFAYGKARNSNRRDPSSHRFIFPVLANSWPKHTDNNIRANWLLKEVIETRKSKFNLLPPSKRLRALESALFMIGYDVTHCQ